MATTYLKIIKTGPLWFVPITFRIFATGVTYKTSFEVTLLIHQSWGVLYTRSTNVPIWEHSKEF